MIINAIAHNSAPRFISFPDLLAGSFQQPFLAQELIDYLEENATPSLLDITGDNVVETVLDNENQLPYPKVHWHIRQIVDRINTVFCMNSHVESIESWNDTVWLRKFTPNEKSIDKSPRFHYDYNTNYRVLKNNRNYSTPDVASLSVALNEDYEGGEIVISHGYNSEGKHQNAMVKPKTGDGILWDGWTMHGVNPVTAGERYVMVVHFQGRLL